MNASTQGVTILFFRPYFVLFSISFYTPTPKTQSPPKMATAASKCWVAWAERKPWIRACAVVSEAADFGRDSRGAVAAVLHDARVAVLGGREHMPRSLGSIYAGSVARFLGGPFQGVPHRSVHLPKRDRVLRNVALDASGTVLVVLYTDWQFVDEDELGDIWTLETFDAATAASLCRPESACLGSAWYLSVAPDGSVFVAAAGTIHAFAQGLTLVREERSDIYCGGLMPICLVADNSLVVVLMENGLLALIKRKTLRRTDVGLPSQRISGSQTLCFLPEDDGEGAHVAVIRTHEERVFIVRVVDAVVLHSISTPFTPMWHSSVTTTVGSFSVGTATVFIALPRSEDCSVASLALSPIGELFVFDSGLQEIRVYT